MPVPATLLFPTVPSPAVTPAPVAEAEAGAFLAALANAGTAATGEAAPQLVPKTVPQAISPPAGLTIPADTGEAVPMAAPIQAPVMPQVQAAPLPGEAASLQPAPVVATDPAEVPPSPTVAAPPVVAPEPAPAEAQPQAAPAQAARPASAPPRADAPDILPVTVAAHGPATAPADVPPPVVPVQSGPVPDDDAAPEASLRPARRKAASGGDPAAAPSTPVQAAPVQIGPAQAAQVHGTAPVQPAAVPGSAAAPADASAGLPASADKVAAAPHAATAQGGPAEAAAAPEARVPAPLFTQTLAAETARHGALPYDTGQIATPTATATVAMREGHFGTDVGVAIARALDAGPDGVRDALLIRLDPRHMGRIDVRMTFEDDGTLRAVVSADQPAALDMLRRESPQLDRALSDAGVRADPQSLRFDMAGGGQQQRGARPQMPVPQAAGQQGDAGVSSNVPGGAQSILRSLRGSGHVDLMA